MCDEQKNELNKIIKHLKNDEPDYWRTINWQYYETKWMTTNKDIYVMLNKKEKYMLFWFNRKEKLAVMAEKDQLQKEERTTISEVLGKWYVKEKIITVGTREIKKHKEKATKIKEKLLNLIKSMEEEND